MSPTRDGGPGWAPAAACHECACNHHAVGCLQSASGEEAAARGAATAEARAAALAALRAGNRQKQRSLPSAAGVEGEAAPAEEPALGGDEDAEGAVKENLEPAAQPPAAPR